MLDLAVRVGMLTLALPVSMAYKALFSFLNGHCDPACSDVEAIVDNDRFEPQNAGQRSVQDARQFFG